MVDNKDDWLRGIMAEAEGALLKSLQTLLPRAEAEEVMQEAFLKLHMENEKMPVQSPLGFVYRAARNLAISRLRHQKVITGSKETLAMHISMQQKNPTAERQLSDQQELGELMDIINLMPPVCKKVFILRKIEGLSHSEIAEQMSVSTNTVENHLSKGMRICRQQMIKLERQKQVHSKLKVAELKRAQS